MFIQGGRTDGMQFTAGQGGFEHVAGIHGAFGLAGADNGVQFINEQDHIPFLFGEIVKQGFHPLLELTAELRASYQRGHVQRQHALAADALGHFVVHDTLGQALNDGCLAHAGFTDQHRVVLGAPLKHLDTAANFLVAANDRVQLALLGEFGQVDGVFFQRLPVFFGIGVNNLFAATHVIDGFHQCLAVRASLFENIGQRTFQLERRQHENLTGDVLIAPFLRQLVAQVQNFDQFIGKADLTLRAADTGQAVQSFTQL